MEAGKGEGDKSVGWGVVGRGGGGAETVEGVGTWALLALEASLSPREAIISSRGRICPRPGYRCHSWVIDCSQTCGNQIPYVRHSPSMP